MKKLLIMTCAAVTMFSAWATATLNGNILTFNVESGEETYSSTLTSTIEGIVKTGAGTIILTASSTRFTSGKPITISGGAIEIQNANALGSGNTVPDAAHRGVDAQVLGLEQEVSQRTARADYFWKARTGLHKVLEVRTSAEGHSCRALAHHRRGTLLAHRRSVSCGGQFRLRWP